MLYGQILVSHWIGLDLNEPEKRCPASVGATEMIKNGLRPIDITVDGGVKLHEIFIFLVARFP
jgi:hypothetical protein